MKAEFRSRFLLIASLVILACALLFILALVPAFAAVASFAPATSHVVSQEGGDVAADSAAIAHTKALLAALSPLSATSSLDAILAALSQSGKGIQVDNISYSVSQRSLALAGHADTPGDVNTFQQALQSDLRFSDISVPVSALLGSQNGSFTITMKINP